jgi:outer membrane protein assembly factor BamB
LSNAALAAEMAMFRGGPAHGGVYSAPGVADAPKIKWKFKTGGAVRSSPAVAGGVAYFGSNDGYLYAVSVETGALKWRFKTGSRVASSPAVQAGAVLFESYDGNLYALDAVSGAVRWKFKTAGERRFAADGIHGAAPSGETMPDPFDFYLSSPAVSGGKVYFGSGDGHVYALDAASGALAWSFATGDVVHASPAVAGGVVFVGSWDSYFYALDAATGALKWRFKTGEDPAIHNQVGIQSSAAVADGVVYFGCRDSNLYAVDAASGKQLWAYNNKGSWVIASPAVDHGVVYAATSDTGQFLALEARTGRLLYSLDFKHWPMFSSPAVTASRAYIGSHQGRLLAIDLPSHRLAWTWASDTSLANGPGLTGADGAPDYTKAFASGFYDDIVAGVIKSLSAGALLSSPVVDGGLILIGSDDGNLYALG